MDFCGHTRYDNGHDHLHSIHYLRDGYPVRTVELLRTSGDCRYDVATARTSPTNPPGGDNKCSQDDIGFFAALLSEISGNYNIDSSKVFLTGYSNGADFSYSMACYQSSLVTAIAPVSGLMPMVDASSECQPSHATSVMIFNGTIDYSRPYNGIDGYMMGVDQTVAYWSQYNNTDSSPQTNIVGDIENYTYLNGDNNTSCLLYTSPSPRD